MYADINKLFSAFNLRITANRLACGHLQADKEGKEKTDEKVDEEERRRSEEMMGRAARPIWSKINRLLRTFSNPYSMWQEECRQSAEYSSSRYQNQREDF